MKRRITAHLLGDRTRWLQARSATTNVGRPFKAGVLQPKAVRRVATFEAKRQINSPIEKIERRIRELHDLGRHPVNSENLVNPVFEPSAEWWLGRTMGVKFP